MPEKHLEDKKKKSDPAYPIFFQAENRNAQKN